jgi:outer membrane protein assembly factor BamB
VGLVLGLGVLLCAVPARAQDAAGWPQFQRDAAHTGTVGEGPEPPYRQIWRYDDPLGSAGLSNPVILGDLVVAVGSTLLYGLDLATGEVEVELDRLEGPLATPVAVEADGRRIGVFTAGGGNDASVAAVDLDGGDRIWTAPIETDSRTGVTLEGDRVFVGDRSGRVYALDLATGRELWEHRDSGDIDAPLVVADGLVLAIVADRSETETRLVAIDVETGRPQWTASPGRLGVVGSGPTVIGGRVLAVFPDRVVRAYNLADGELLWTSPLRGFVPAVSSGAAVNGDLLIADLADSAAPGALYRLDGDSGDRLWDFQFDSIVLRGSPVGVGDAAVLGLGEGELVAVDLASGRLIWRHATGDGELGGIAVGPDTLVVKKGGREGGLVAFAHDPEGELVSEVSPTELDLAEMLSNLGLGLLVVLAGAYVLFRLGVGTLLARGSAADRSAGGDDEAEGEPA